MPGCFSVVKVDHKNDQKANKCHAVYAKRIFMGFPGKKPRFRELIFHKNLLIT